MAESIANIAVGSGIALLSQIVIFGALRIDVGMRDELVITAFFTVISIVRSFTLRRLFEALRVRGILPVIVFCLAFAAAAHAGPADCKAGEHFDEHHGCTP